MTTVAVTGASGYLGRVLLDLLGRQPHITRVIGIDVAEPTFTTRNLEFYRMDVRSPALSDVVSGASVLVHLAFIVDDDPDETKDVNVGGTRLAIESAVHSGVRKVIYVSSTMAYGAHPDNDFPLTEDSPLRPARDLPHSAHNAEGEEIVKAFAATHPDVQVVILRFCPVFGPTLQGTGVRFVESRYGFGVRGYETPAQALHEQDAARALRTAVTTDLQGTYNVCPDDTIANERVMEILGQRRIELEPGDAHRVAARLSRWQAGTPSAFVPFLMYPWIASSEKLRATGFSFEHTSEDALRAGAGARKGWVSVGPAHFRPKRVALVAGTLGAVLLGSAVRGRRARRAKVGS